MGLLDVWPRMAVGTSGPPVVAVVRRVVAVVRRAVIQTPVPTIVQIEAQAPVRMLGLRRSGCEKREPRVWNHYRPRWQGQRSRAGSAPLS